METQRGLRIGGAAVRRMSAAALLAAVGVRVAVLDARSLWFDETFSVAVARLSLPEVWRVIGQTDAHPPLHYLLLHVWMGLGDSPATVRLLSLLCGVLAVVVAWWLARALGGRLLAATAALLLAAAALSIQASVEARMFSLLALLSTGATAALWHASANAREWWRWVVYGTLLALAWYASYLAFFLVPAHVAFVAISRRQAPILRGTLVALALAAVLYAPWWPTMAQQLGEGRAARIWQGAMPPTAPINIVALSSFGGYLFGLGGYLLDDGGWSWMQVPLVLPFLVLVGVGAVTLPRRGGGLLLVLSWSVPVLALVGLSLLTGFFYAIPRYVSFVQPLFLILLAQGVITVAKRGGRVAGFAAATAGIILVNLIVLQASLANPRYQPYDWAGAARHVRQRWWAPDRLLFYPHTARVAFGYYFPEELEGAVTLYPPPWTRQFSRAELVRAFPSLPALVKDAPRVWVVLTEPVPPQSREALLEVLEGTYVRREVADFRHVYVLLYERR